MWTKTEIGGYLFSIKFQRDILVFILITIEQLVCCWVSTGRFNEKYTSNFVITYGVCMRRKYCNRMIKTNFPFDEYVHVLYILELKTSPPVCLSVRLPVHTIGESRQAWAIFQFQFFLDKSTIKNQKQI